MLKKLVSLITICLLTTLILSSGEFECGHGLKQNEYPEQEYHLTRFERRMRQSIRLYDSPIRIHIDTTNVNGTERERALVTRVMSNNY